MILIIGGAYQGKLDHAKKVYSLSEDEVFSCTAAQIDFSRRCVCCIEEFTYACVCEGIDPIGYFKNNRPLWESSILICRDLSCGIVPMGDRLRRWRQVTGRLCQYLSSEAAQVSRIFCGLEQRLK